MRFRFTIRDLLWLTLVVALVLAMNSVPALSLRFLFILVALIALSFGYTWLTKRTNPPKRS